jgi:hypothetical protein
MVLRLPVLDSSLLMVLSDTKARDMNLALIGNTMLRAAIRRNLVSFPSQIPAFTKGGDAQKRVVQLYFVLGWPSKAICDRYGLTKSTLRTLLSDWKIRAVAAGYIQDIHPEFLAVLAAAGEVDRREVFGQSTFDSDSAAVKSASPMDVAQWPSHGISAEAGL